MGIDGNVERPSQAVAFGAIDKATPSPSEVVPDRTSLKEERDFQKEVHVEVHRIVIYGLRFGAVILAILLVVRFWHLAAPVGGRWLTDSEIQSMDKMLFSSAFGGFVFAYLRDALLNGSSRRR